MKKTIIKVGYENGAPLDIEIYGKRLSSVSQRAVFYLVVTLLIVGAVWATFNVLFPLVWFVLKLLLSIIGFGFIVITLVAAAVILIGILRWRSGSQKKDDSWDN